MITIDKSKSEAIQIFVTTKNQTRIVLEFCATVNGRFFELNLKKNSHSILLQSNKVEVEAINQRVVVLVFKKIFLKYFMIINCFDT